MIKAISNRVQSIAKINISDLSEKGFDIGILKFIGLVLITFLTTYFTSPFVSSVWYVLLLVLYYRSKDEAVWLAFFLITVDGFMGFFGLYSVTLSFLPGLPAIELSQFYILLSAVKAFSKKSNYPVFYKKYLQILLFYLLFLILWGQMMGVSGELNVYLRILKGTLPFLLFYSIPRLMQDFQSYKRFFGILFIVILLAFSTQIFTLLTGIVPNAGTVVIEEQIREEGDFRTFYNATGSLIGIFGALFFLSIRGKSGFNPVFLFFVIFSCIMMAIISATRGWIISFLFMTLLSGLLVKTIDIRKIAGIIIVSVILIFIGLKSEKISDQFSYSRERLFKLEALSKGDITAEGTLNRLAERSPRVIGAWRRNPIFGWGFSDEGYKNNDGHVGNQNLLMFSGVIGFLLLNGFLVFIIYKLFSVYSIAPRSNPFKNSYLIIVLFFIGWFIIHSSSGQQFDFSGLPIRVLPQSVILGFIATCYNYSKNYQPGKS